jgi:hypothetical protein
MLFLLKDHNTWIALPITNDEVPPNNEWRSIYLRSNRGSSVWGGRRLWDRGCKRRRCAVHYGTRHEHASSTCKTVRHSSWARQQHLCDSTAFVMNTPAAPVRQHGIHHEQASSTCAIVRHSSWVRQQHLCVSTAHHRDRQAGQRG